MRLRCQSYHKNKRQKKRGRMQKQALKWINPSAVSHPIDKSLALTKFILTLYISINLLIENQCLATYCSSSRSSSLVKTERKTCSDLGLLYVHRDHICRYGLESTRRPDHRVTHVHHPWSNFRRCLGNLPDDAKTWLQSSRTSIMPSFIRRSDKLDWVL